MEEARPSIACHAPRPVSLIARFCAKPEPDIERGISVFEQFYQAGPDCQLQPGAQVGLKYREGCRPVVCGAHARIRSGTIIYADVTIGDFFETGHHALIRADTVIGDHVTIGSNVVVEGQVRIGNFVKIESNCFIPTHCRLGDRIFLGPSVTILNDRYPLRMREEYRPEGCVIENNATIGGGVVLLPGIRIGAGSFLAAGAVVTKDVPRPRWSSAFQARSERCPSACVRPTLHCPGSHICASRWGRARASIALATLLAKFGRLFWPWLTIPK